ncbi:MAG: CrcB family protein [Candidatus Delongbacteria bacterium]
MTKLLLLAGAGALGTLARYGLAGLVQQQAGTRFPWGTLTVNLLGCLLFGFLWGLMDQRLLLPPGWRAPLLIGFLGAFTTFSTWIFESGQFLQGGQWLAAGANLLLPPLVGLLSLALGLGLARLV